MEKENHNLRRGVARTTRTQRTRQRHPRRALLEPLETRVLLTAVAFWEPKLIPIQPPFNQSLVAAREMVIADLNGDGKNDIAMAQSGQVGWADHYLGILLNRGDGTFFPVAHYPTDIFLRDMTHGDFDADGHLDFAVVTEQMVQLFFNHGDGTFAPAVNATTYFANSARTITSGDFNGDGNLDLAAFDIGAQATDILLNQGNKTFTKVHQPGMLATDAADMNADGSVDLIGRSDMTASAKLRVWFNDGSGGFNTHADSLVDPASQLTDLNGDGRPDAVGSGGQDILSIALNDGNGSFGATVKYWQPHLANVTTADMNADGKPDLVTSSLADTIAVRLNAGDGTFGAPRHVHVTFPVVYGLAAGDLNGDGAADLAVQVNAYERYAMSVMLHRNTTGRPTAVTLAQSSQHTPVWEAVTFTAKVTPEGGGPAIGRVRFVVDGVTWASVPLKNGVAQFQTSALSPSQWTPGRQYHTVVAVYDGNAALAGSSSQRVAHAVAGPARRNLHRPVGSVDFINGRIVQGWAIDSDTRHSPVEIQIRVDGNYLGATLANQYRRDLAQRFGSARHGFTFTLPDLAPGKHRVEVFAVDTGARQWRLLLAREVTVGALAS